MTFSKKIVYVDVDDTFVRTCGTKRIPIPHVLRYLRKIYEEGAVLFCWSSGGGAYAKKSAIEFKIDSIFTGFLPKPNILIDDVAIEDWRYLEQIHPNECTNTMEVEF